MCVSKIKQMTIRRAKINDLEEVLTIFSETIKSTCKRDYSEEQIKVWVSSINDKEKWKNKIINQFFIVVEFENRMVGFGSLEKGDYIDLMYVHKDYLRKGIANRIYQKLKEEAQKNGNKELTSDVSKTARSFFEKAGFVVIKENEFDLKGVKISNYLMKLYK